MNFTSQICTTKEQSERLVVLRLKKETADCFWLFNTSSITGKTHCRIIVGEFEEDNRCIPAWSLHRLIEMIPSFIDIGEHTYMFSIIQGKLFSYSSDIAGNAFLYGKGSVYDSAIYTIECLIKGGYFNKEYLE
jgi:hypothetical protein